MLSDCLMNVCQRKSCMENYKLENAPMVVRRRDTRTPSKKGKRKVQGVPQSQTAVLPRPQEEEKTDKSKQAQIEQTYE